MLAGKTVLLTGAGRGIGNAILTLLAQNHADVLCLVRRREAAFLEQTENLEKQYRIRIRSVQAELSEEDSIRQAMRELRDEPVDILINNAAENYRGSFLLTPRRDMERIFSVNYFAPVLLTQLAAKKMIRKKEGIIVNVCSASGMEHHVGNFAYAASKAALVWATQTISRELAPYHIRVNGIAPGVTDTGMNDGKEDMIRETLFDRMNIRRMAAPEEIAQGVLFLISDQSSFISGQILKVDGGRF